MVNAQHFINRKYWPNSVSVKQNVLTTKTFKRKEKAKKSKLKKKFRKSTRSVNPTLKHWYARQSLTRGFHGDQYRQRGEPEVTPSNKKWNEIILSKIYLPFHPYRMIE